MKTREIAGLILYDKDKKILLQHRDKDARIMPGYWGIFGGKMEEGETREQALVRELREELEYVPRAPVFLSTHDYVNEGQRFIVHTFMERYDESQPLVQHEGQGMGWFTIDEAYGLKISEQRRHDLADIKKYLDTL